MRKALGRAMTATVVESVRGKRSEDQPTRERPLSKFELRVLLALVGLVGLYDRVEDEVANLQIVRFMGLPEGDGKPALNAQREVRRALDALSGSGVIRREPGLGRRASRVSFLVLAEGGTAPLEGGTAPPAERGTGEPREGYQTDREGGRGTPHPSPLREISEAHCSECGAPPGAHHGMVERDGLGAVRCPNALRPRSVA